MCFYITATLPKGTQVEKFRKLLDEYNMSFSPLHNPLIESQLRPGDLYFRATKEYCDCDTIVGSLNNLQDFQNLYNSKKVKKLKKKKWSEEKINNWIKEKLETKKLEKRNKITPLETKQKVERWVDFLHHILDEKLVSRIGILKHWYTRGLEDEDIKIKKFQRININDLNQNILLNLSEDTLYEFLPSYHY
ncbi:MAG: hypothetical protein ACFFEN_07405 [Candidatus Thorarchaeota archaeon]